MRDAILLVRESSPRRFAFVCVLQVLAAGVLGAQVLFGREALAAVLDADRGAVDVSAVVLPIVGLAVTTAVTSLAAQALTLQYRLLGDLTRLSVEESILDVTGAVELERYDDPRFFDHLQRVQTGAVPRPVMITHGLMQFLGGVAGVAGLTIILLTLQPLLVPLLLAAGAPLLLVSRRGGSVEFSFAVHQSPTTRLRDHLLAVLTGRNEAKEARAFHLREPFRAKYRQVWARYISDLRVMISLRQRQVLVSSAITTFVTIATLVLLVVLLVQDRISVAGAGAAAIAVRLLASRVEMAILALGGLFEGALFLLDLEEFRRLVPHRAPPLDAAPAGFSRLEAHDLRFVYPGADTPALDGVDLTVRRGEVIGLVGENGSGKSTLAMILAGLLHPVDGRVTWDGSDIATFDAGSVRRQVSVVFQDFVRYAMSAADNISLGHRPAHADVVRSARASGAHDFVERLPDGYATLLSSEYAGGTDLSDGQWQRIALARAFHRMAPFVVLDEPATALDPNAEHELFETVRTLFVGRTVLVISHRLSNVRFADRIVVLDAGRVVEQGTHEELMAAGGRYADMFTIQAEGYLTTEPERVGRHRA